MFYQLWNSCRIWLPITSISQFLKSSTQCVCSLLWQLVQFISKPKGRSVNRSFLFGLTKARYKLPCAEGLFITDDAVKPVVSFCRKIRTPTNYNEYWLGWKLQLQTISFNKAFPSLGDVLITARYSRVINERRGTKKRASLSQSIKEKYVTIAMLK